VSGMSGIGIGSSRVRCRRHHVYTAGSIGVRWVRGKFWPRIALRHVIRCRGCSFVVIEPYELVDADRAALKAALKARTG
jgi:hypothetical protein